MKVESVPIASLVFDPSNARLHDNKNLDAIKGSLTKFGQVTPIVIDEKNVILKGNGTAAAAKDLGWESIQVIRRTDLNEVQKTAYAIADNRSGELAAWDEAVLTKSLLSLQAEAFDLDAIGFDDDDLEKLFKDIGAEDKNYDDEQLENIPDNVPSRVNRGDIWKLGNHRLMCGDSTLIEDINSLIQKQKIDFVYMDPPYGMGLNTDYHRSNREVGKTYKPVIGDDQDFDPSFWLEIFSEARESFWWGADYYCQHLPKNGSWIVWDKKKDDLDESIGAGFELCWSKNSHKRIVARFLWSGFTAKERDETRVHPTQKPISLAVWFFDRWGKDGDLVIDLFLGSGTTLIACEKTGRRCFGMEIDPAYCDIILERWEKLTGQKAEKVHPV